MLVSQHRVPRIDDFGFMTSKATTISSWRGSISWLLLLLVSSGLDVAVPSVAHSADKNAPFVKVGAEVRFDSCWSARTPETVEEIGYDQANRSERSARQARTVRAVPNAMLALSSGWLRTAYGAGLIVGWGETGYRPDFTIVTAVGPSALLAPFVFVGPDFDQVIADLFNCRAENWEELARRAASHIDEVLIERIARKHAAGGRLLVALEGTAARPEVVWDVGRIAASGHPNAALYISEVMLAAVNGSSFLAPESVPIPAGTLVERNRTFRKVGAGEAFLRPEPTRMVASHFFIIHNGVLFRDESETYAKSRRSDPGVNPPPNMPLVPAYDLLAQSKAQHAIFRIAAIKPRLNLKLNGFFDLTYMRGLFEHAYRQGRMHKEWQIARGESDVVRGAHDE
jgi:hypothetical protein